MHHLHVLLTLFFFPPLFLPLFLSLAPPLPPLNRTASPSLPLPHHISPTSSSTAFSVATMRNPDLISKGKKVKQGIEQILIAISSLSLSFPSPGEVFR